LVLCGARSFGKYKQALRRKPGFTSGCYSDSGKRNERLKALERRTEMEWQIIVVLAVVAPLMLFPAAFIWYVTLGGLYKERRMRHAERATAKGTLVAHPA
jgi:hypothetical protein